MDRWGLKLWLYIMVCIVVCTSCGVTRHIPPEEYLLRKVRIKQSKETPKEERIDGAVLERYVRQTPNTRLFGFNFYIWIYNQANPEKQNWWNNLKRSIGEEPTYFDELSTEQSETNLKIYMNSQGFYAAQSSFTVDTTSQRKRAKVTYNLDQGRPYKIESLEYEFLDSLLRPLVLPDTVNSLIKVGDIFSVMLLDEERERITTNLRSKGYYDFTVRNIEYRADTLAGNHSAKLWMIIKQPVVGYDNRGRSIYGANTQYILNRINVLPNFNPTQIMQDSAFLNSLDTLSYRGVNIVYPSGEEPNVRKNVLRQMIPLNSGTIYNSKMVETAYKNLMSLGYFRSARISFTPDSTAMSLIGIDSMTNSPIGYLNSNILCTPALKQSYDIQLDMSTTSSFYGINLSVGYQNRNIFRGAESWDVNFTTGYEYMKNPDATKRNATEIGISTGLSFPRFMLPFTTRQFLRTVQPQTAVELSVNFQDRPYYNRTLSSASWSYTWRNSGYSSYLVRPIDINLVDMNYIDEDYFDALTNDYLRNSYITQLIAGLSLGYVYNNQLQNIGGNSKMLRVNFETAGNMISVADRMLRASRNEDDQYEIMGIPYAQYVRADINMSHKWALGRDLAVAARLYGGVGYAYGNSTSIPFDRLFYSGGSNSMRGWTPRTLGPGSVIVDTSDAYPSQLGDMKLEANIELRFPLWDNFHGATFFDVGNIWYLKDSEGVYDPDAIFHGDTFYKQLGFNTGFGIRMDLQFAVLRLDWGIQLHNPNVSEESRWVIKDFKFSNTSLNFGVGYPF